MIISVASGKGGTGKTTVATSLALALAPDVDVTFLDCDVEEPNAHLFLNPALTGEQPVTTFVPEINEERCSLCRKCADICRFSALAAAGKKLLVFPELCHGCEGCLEVCPENAISAGSRSLGVIESGRIGKMHFHSGRLRIGEAMAPPLIRQVRKWENQSEITIIDAPPGTSCPVISAMKNSDFVLMVTEPTPFGLHDLRLAVEAVGMLGIDAGLVVNRADIGDDRVRRYAEDKKIPILLQIPFDREIAQSYSQGRTIVERYPDWADKFKGLYRDIMRIVMHKEHG
ncbi:P-loop NTPase [Desulforhopalus singaporensis]|uniref:MinD superfamily P-loop ATPase, contains an inserted ferredoxin domain n=1 Tax=Desulforhopalus singaporensis TaxID=91360 RepID=A0A1H0M0I1_9BACT|nr:ATP-binding protein [Desulforhopalus singaporensis]SDO73895.1 MinD superfamily P-loop ATPase, contains an inserted ferredoxin domain [Desulforhopalus singaporensis]